MSPKTRFQVMLEPGQLEQMKFLEAQIGVPVSEQIRRAVDGWFESDPIVRKVMENFSPAERPSRAGKEAARKIKRSK